MMYDLLHEKILIRVPCGGGHRSWDCMILDRTASFAYIRNKQVYVFDYPLKSLKSPILQVRKINLSRKLYEFSFFLILSSFLSRMVFIQRRHIACIIF